MREFRTHKWPLNVSNFTWRDRIKLAKFFLNPSNRWTMGDKVKEFEKKMAEFVGARYALFVSSGSTANTLLAMWLKDKRIKEKNVVVFPSTTWITSVSPFIREGFTPKFIDISLDDLSMNLDSLESYLRDHSSEVAAVFITSLVGLTPNINKIKNISLKYNVLVMLDNCENTFGQFNGKNISRYFVSTTSTYFGHQIQSVEGGFVFSDTEAVHEKLLMYRNHGMVRSLENCTNKNFYINPKVNPQFDFFCLGNNYRNTDIHALIGLLDMKRIGEYIYVRNQLYERFVKNIDPEKYVKFTQKFPRTDCMFCIPIIALPDKKGHNRKSLLRIEEAKKYCVANSIEYRPMISGNLLRQTCFKHYGNAKDFTVSEYIHDYGFYVGLHPKVKMEDIDNLVNNLNSL